MKPLTIKPTHDNIIVENVDLVEGGSAKKGDILYVVSSSETSKQRYGIVVATGKGVKVKSKYIPPAVKEGDKVLYLTESSTKVKIEGRDVVIIKEDAILAVEE